MDSFSKAKPCKQEISRKNKGGGGKQDPNGFESVGATEPGFPD